MGSHVTQNLILVSQNGSWKRGATLFPIFAEKYCNSVKNKTGYIVYGTSKYSSLEVF